MSYGGDDLAKLLADSLTSADISRDGALQAVETGADFDSAKQGGAGLDDRKNYDFDSFGATLGSTGTFATFRLRELSPAEEVCFGLIGGGASLCIKSNCFTKHHGGRAPPEEMMLFVVKAGESVYSNPRLPSHCITEETKSLWLSQAKTLEDWTLMFQSAQVGFAMTNDEVNEATEVVKAAVAFKTPAKKKARVASPAMARFEPYISELGDSVERLNTQDAIKATLRALRRVEKSMEESSGEVLRLNQNLKSGLQDLDDDLTRVGIKVDFHHEAIGTIPVVFADRLDSTLWGSLGILSDRIDEDKFSVRVDALVPKVDHLEKKTVELSDTVKAFATKVDVDSIKADLVSAVRNVIVRLVQAENHIQSLNAQTPPGSILGDPQPSLADLSKIRAEIQQLASTVATLSNSKDTSAIKFSGLGFTSITNVRAWVVSHPVVLRYGLMIDPFVLLEMIYGESETASMLNDLEKQSRLKLETGSEALSIESLRFCIPRLFHKGRPLFVADRKTSYLSQLSDFSRWSNGGDGMKDLISDRINALQESLTIEIRHEFDGDADAEKVAQEALSKSVSWIFSLMAFMDMTYEKLTRFSKFSSAQAWSLTTRIVSRIFNDLFTYRQGVYRSIRVQNQSDICAKILWTIFQTHDLMAVYEKHNFENHPSVASEYVQFLATNSGIDLVDKLKAEVASLNAKLETLKERATTAKKKADQASNAVDDLKNKFNQLKREVSGRRGE